MSILQEYESIRKTLTKEEKDGIREYLRTHQEIFLSDIYYSEEHWNTFKKWLKKNYNKGEKK